MTIICVDRKLRVMAADQLLVSSDCQEALGSVCKIHATPKALIGVAGDSAKANLFLEWYLKPLPRAYKPNFRGMEALVLTSDHTLFLYSGTYLPEILIDDFAAIGAGAQVARGARFMGADILDCVSAACHFLPTCGGLIDLFGLDGSHRVLNAAPPRFISAQ